MSQEISRIINCCKSTYHKFYILLFFFRDFINHHNKRIKKYIWHNYFNVFDPIKLVQLPLLFIFIKVNFCLMKTYSKFTTLVITKYKALWRDRTYKYNFSFDIIQGHHKKMTTQDSWILNIWIVLQVEYKVGLNETGFCWIEVFIQIAPPPTPFPNRKIPRINI